MERLVRGRALWLVCFLVYACFGCGPSAKRLEHGVDSTSAAIRPIGVERVGSPIALARAGDKTFAYIANADDATLHILDVDRRREVAVAELGDVPSDLLLTRDGRLIVSFREANRMQLFRLVRPDRAPEPEEHAIVPLDPVGLALSEDEETLLVTSALGQMLSAYRAEDLAHLWHRRLERDPWDMALSDDGNQVFVSHAVGGRVSVVSLLDPNTSPRSIEISSTLEADRAPPSMMMIDKQKRPPRMRRAVQNFSLAKSVSPSGRIFAPGVLVDPGDAEVAAGGYGDTPLTELSDIAVLDADGEQVLRASVASHVPLTNKLNGGQAARQCLLPRAATVDPKNGMLLVACSGMDVVLGFDGASANPTSARASSWHVAYDPVGIAVDGERRQALVWSQQKRSVDFIRLDDATGPEPHSERVDLSRKARHEKGELALGRALFHKVGDRRISVDGRGCASCHVDGRDDGLTWATPEGPRQTPALAGRVLGTKPFGWDGSGADVAEHLSQTFRRLHGSGLSERELAALITYVESLRLPTASEDDASSEERARGRSIFFSAKTGCSVCHNGPRFTDGQLHDVGSRARADQDGQFNTPSLIGLRGSAPYFHDGRFASLEQMLMATNGKMGRTKHLSRSDFSALIAFLESL